MKIIDILNKIANDEEVPKKIKYLYYEYEFNEEEKEYQRLQNEVIYGLGEDRRLDIVLDDEVEIIEEPQEHKIPEKFKVHSWGDKDKNGSYVDSPFPTKEELMNKINEILDYLEEIK